MCVLIFNKVVLYRLNRMYCFCFFGFFYHTFVWNGMESGNRTEQFLFVKQGEASATEVVKVVTFCNQVKVRTLV